MDFTALKFDPVFFINTFLSKINFTAVLKVAIGIVIFLAVAKLVNYFLNKVFKKLIDKVSDFESKKQYNTLRLISVSVADVVLFLFFGTNILQSVGIDMKPILAAAGVFGVAVGFGAKRFIEDVISGLNILLTGQIRVGDYVTVQGISGMVEKVTLTMIVLRSYEGCVNYIRNGLIDIITNQTRDFSYAVLDVSVAYKENIAYVIDVIKDVAKEIKLDKKFNDVILSDIEVFGLDKFEDSSILIKSRIKTLPQSQWEVKRAFNLKLKEKFDDLNIEIPFPQLVVTEVKS